MHLGKEVKVHMDCFILEQMEISPACTLVVFEFSSVRPHTWKWDLNSIPHPKESQESPRQQPRYLLLFLYETIWD